MSDWSSDVCSSDLDPAPVPEIDSLRPHGADALHADAAVGAQIDRTGLALLVRLVAAQGEPGRLLARLPLEAVAHHAEPARRRLESDVGDRPERRSAATRGGDGCVRKWRLRW